MACAAIHFLQSLIQLWGSVSLLRLVLDGRWDAKYSSAFIGNPYVAVFMKFAIAMLSAMRQFTKFVCPQLVGEHCINADRRVSE